MATGEIVAMVFGITALCAVICVPIWLWTRNMPVTCVNCKKIIKRRDAKTSSTGTSSFSGTGYTFGSNNSGPTFISGGGDTRVYYCYPCFDELSSGAFRKR